MVPGAFESEPPPESFRGAHGDVAKGGQAGEAQHHCGQNQGGGLIKGRGVFEEETTTVGVDLGKASAASCIGREREARVAWSQGIFQKDSAQPCVGSASGAGFGYASASATSAARDAAAPACPGCRGCTASVWRVGSDWRSLWHHGTPGTCRVGSCAPGCAPGIDGRRNGGRSRPNFCSAATGIHVQCAQRTLLWRRQEQGPRPSAQCGAAQGTQSPPVAVPRTPGKAQRGDGVQAEHLHRAGEEGGGCRRRVVRGEEARGATPHLTNSMVRW